MKVGHIFKVLAVSAVALVVCASALAELIGVSLEARRCSGRRRSASTSRTASCGRSPPARCRPNEVRRLLFRFAYRSGPRGIRGIRGAVRPDRSNRNHRS
jgi:hypothetical protein